LPEHAATKVVARRVGAVLVVTVVLALLSAIAWFALVHRFDSRTSRGGGFVIGHTRYAFDNSTSRAVWLAIVVVLALAIFVVLPGLRGISPGKALAGIRVVNSAGAPPGIGRALVRALLWIADLFPYILPGLVGFVVARSSRGNQRIGDMAASTWVVRRSEQLKQ
jgi:uncharacterized RDD family membrane protein YckC